MSKSLALLVAVALLQLSFALPATAMAGCVPAAIGTAGDDTIVCTDGVHERVSGLAGNDTIILEAGTRVDNQITGDGAPGPHGDDRIIVRNGVILDDLLQVIADSGNGASPGGNDRVQFASQVEGDISGDGLVTQGGDDVIGILPAGVALRIFGDSGVTGGNDTITIAGRVTEVRGDGVQEDGGNDVIAITVGAAVEIRDERVGGQGSVRGDSTRSGKGGNDFMIIRGRVDAFVIGDSAQTGGGRDFIRIYPAARIYGGVIGDLTLTGNGGPDTIVAFAGARIDGLVYGDDARAGNGGNDKMSIGATVAGPIIGDIASGNGGHDSIGIGGAGSAWRVFGDDVGGDGGNDILDISGTISGDVAGDRAAGAGGADTIFLRSTASARNVLGDSVGGAGGNDLIVVNAGALVTGQIDGDNSTGGSGGDDIIRISGTVGSVQGDGVLGAGGNDTIVVNPAGVTGQIDGDNTFDGPGGDDVIRIAGTAGFVRGDGVIGDGGNDTIVVNPGGVTGPIEGDGATGAGGNDVFRIAGTVQGWVYADGSVLGGNDSITIIEDGTVNGGIDARLGTNVIRVLGTVNGPVLCSATTTLIIGPQGSITGDTSTC